MNDCLYCEKWENNKPLGNDTLDLGVLGKKWTWIQIRHNALSVLSFPEEDEQTNACMAAEGVHLMEIPITYCPKCKRKLR